MSMSDPIADLLTRVRNGLAAEKEFVSMPSSKMKRAVANVLKQEGYVGDVSVEDVDGKQQLIIKLRYYEGEPVIEALRRVSRPGRRTYVGKDDLPSINGGYGVAIVSTSKGVMTEKSARASGVGGEVICAVY
ncbi:MAG: 30S ribosomal protein S8 [Arenicellales bacterium WSBS_2016_MAG_OTU3]